jgi:hypothetical protein
LSGKTKCPCGRPPELLKLKNSTMKKIFLFSLAATLICSLSFATIRRVGYFGSAVSGVDYSTFQLAHNASAAGDTIMMFPGSDFSQSTMSKRLVVIGPGYFLSQNAGLQANALGMDSVPTGQTLVINNTAANGSIFQGCSVPVNGMKLDAEGLTNITFQRCWFLGESSQFSVQFSKSVNNINFLQCVFKSSAVTYENSTTVATNVSFINCLFYAPGNGFHYGVNFSNNSPHSGLFQNCIMNSFNNNGNFYFRLNGTWVINNSIANINPTYFEGSGISFQNCVGTSNQFPVGNGNKQNQTWENIFTLTGSTDARYTLKAGSPAIGAGIGGTDCGIFGGTTPYKLSGIPSIPTIYAISSPQGNTPTVNTVQINLSTRSNN